MKFIPGQSGNPLGGAAAKPFRDALRMEIAAAGENSKALRLIARALLDRAETGDVAAITSLADRLDGRVPQTIGQSDEHRPQKLIISWRSDPEPEVIEHVQAIALPTPEKDEELP